MLQRTLQISCLYLCGVLLHGCATPLDIGVADRKLTPQQAITTIDTVRNRMIAWGGVLVSVKNLTGLAARQFLQCIGPVGMH